MDKKKLIELTNKLYKLTLFFPKKEPLRYRVRETADRILENFIIQKVIHRDLEVMDAYLEVVKWQSWISYFDVLKMKEEYGKIKDSPIIEKPEEKFNEPGSLNLKKKEKFNEPGSLNLRQRKILEILKEKEMVQVWEVNKILSDVSKRTLRRDFEQLLKQGLVDRVGEKSKTFYKLART
ncbi:MAG: DeoR family transcriptional regulator [Nanoarchaeota archaeon]|nr:DeoR family transcriptional regulator [Nanoarchaeota archaeon]